MNMLKAQGTDNETYTGWQVGDQLVHPPAAYTSDKYWLNSFMHQFPEKAKRMREHDEKHGFTPVVFYKRWVPVTINWLNKHYAAKPKR